MSKPDTILKGVLHLYGINPQQIKPFGSGLINHTWLVHSDSQTFILQRVNTDVFKKPEVIAANINSIAAFLKDHEPSYFFVTPILTILKMNMVEIKGSFYRLFPFVANSHTVDVVKNPRLAEEAARQFGLFTKTLQHFNPLQLKTTIPGFHDLGWRYQQFKTALHQGNRDRIQVAQIEIAALENNTDIVETFNHINTTKVLVQRVTHHDTKISNVLFDETGNGICVIDLDTVMPGYFISDVGDMIRTYLSPVSEEEGNLALVEVRDDYFAAIVKGYLTAMANVLTKTEIKYFVYSGKFMIYMQALRFLTDYLNNDQYYGAVYEGQNLVRAKNQLRLLEKVKEKEALYLGIVEEFTENAARN